MPQNKQNDKIHDYIEAFKYKFPTDVLSSELLNSNQNKVYAIQTKDRKYILKQYSHNTINNLKDLRIKEEQHRVWSIWNDSSIKCILPLTEIFIYNDFYYTIYPFFEWSYIPCENLSIEQIKILAKNQAKIHKLTISTSLNNHIKKFIIEEPSLSFFNNKMDFVFKASRKHCCLCQNDYKPLNILRKWDHPFLIDYDAVAFNHPTFSLFEAIFTFSYQNQRLNFHVLEEYFKAYLKEYGQPLKDLELAYYGAWNGKLQWIDFLLKNRPNDPDVEIMRYQILDSFKHKEKILTIASKYI